MTPTMKLRDLQRKLRKAGCKVLRDTGRHTVWACPCGSHTAPVPRHTNVSPGVVASIESMMACLPKGWLK